MTAVNDAARVLAFAPTPIAAAMGATSTTPSDAVLRRVLTGLRESAARDRRPVTCTGCQNPDAGLVTSAGYCLTCAVNACESGDGDAVGLPTPTNPLAAAVALAFQKHTTTCPSHANVNYGCLICRLASHECPECRGNFAAVPSGYYYAGNHLVVNGFVLRGCEGYVTPAARAAALHA